MVLARVALRGVVGGAVALGATSALCFSQTVRSSHVQLASSVRSPNLPTAVLVHGLDSSKETWSAVVAELQAAGYPAIALDLRGHGESPLGDVADFSPRALASDVLAAIRAHDLERVVLVGHSMGGRVVMRAAAMDAESERPLLTGGAVIVEDMDVSPRQWDEDARPPAEQAALARFGDEARGRRFASWEDCRRALLPWYEDEARVDSWRDKRVRPLPGGSGIASCLSARLSSPSSTPSGRLVERHQPARATAGGGARPPLRRRRRGSPPPVAPHVVVAAPTALILAGVGRAGRPRGAALRRAPVACRRARHGGARGRSGRHRRHGSAAARRVRALLRGRGPLHPQLGARRLHAGAATGDTHIHVAAGADRVRVAQALCEVLAEATPPPDTPTGGA